MVEHLLAKEDVASSSLVTRSSLRFHGESEGWSECAVAARRRTADSLKAMAGKPFFIGSLAVCCYLEQALF